MNFALVVAGGLGKRMNTEIPKQFLNLEGLPVLMRSIIPFSKLKENHKIYVVIPEEHQDYWMNLCYKYKFPVQHLLVNGGSSRFQSVKNGLEAIFQDADYNQEESIISIHDGARPLLSIELAQNLVELTKKHHAVIPVLESVDSLRIIDSEGQHKVMNRDLIKRVQTPQVFLGKVLQEAYKVEESPEFTDDATVVENIRIPIFLIDGDPINIKITSPLDFYVATTFLKDRV